MRLVIDCNVVTAAGLTDGACRQALSLALTHHLILVSAEIMAEYAMVASRPKFRSQVRDQILSAADDIARHALHVDVASFAGPVKISDPKDGVYVLIAAAGHADAILTGNFRDFTETQYGGARVISVREFLALYG